MNREFVFKQVDVFTRVPFRGNPVAVILGAEGLTREEMQRIACWTNLSETTFLLPPSLPGADYRLRIFTPREELPFAGHPTVGSAHALLESGGVAAGKTRLVQECPAGLVELRVTGEGEERKISVRVPQSQVEEVGKDLTFRIGEALGAPGFRGEARSDARGDVRDGRAKGAVPEATVSEQARLVDVGPKWLVLRLDSEETVRGLHPSMEKIADISRETGVGGITVFALTRRKDAAVYVRSFAPAHGIPEDPVCGSGNASVGAYLLHARLLEKTGPSYLANQGLELGRNGLVNVDVDAGCGSIRIGGTCVTCMDGRLFA